MKNRALVFIYFPVSAAFCLAVALQVRPGTQATSPADPLVAGFQRVAIASVSDAVDSVTGERGFMSYEMRPIVKGRLAGRAVTALVKPATPDQATPQLAVKHAVEMIDNAQAGEVGVIVIEDGLNVAGIGGLMGTAARARGMAGIVVDGGVRDVEELRSLGLPVYARSITPATAVGRYATVARDIAVQCAGITVRPGDFIVAGEDGIVRVPKDKAEEVLARAREIDERESKMVPLINQLKSLQKAIELFNRI
jgi:regulator of RNase E activity RraA